MSEQTQDNLRMPSREERVRQVVDRLDTMGLRSKLVELDTPTLVDLGMRLSDRTLTTADAHRWLNTELGGDEENQVVDDNQVYRFAAHFKRIYSQVTSEHARRIVKLNVAHATDANIETMAKVAQHQLVELTTEKLIDADNLDDFTAQQFGLLLSSVGQQLKTQHDTAKLALEARLADQRAAKLEAEVTRLRQRIEEDRREAEQQRAAQAKAIEEAQRAVDDGADSGAVVSKMREMLGLPPKGGAAA